jgi:3-hydroxyacyl-CoA dehydrogenase/enoyl-CoA hydratase/3-hydroxybutyryl-CoA epimerase
MVETVGRMAGMPVGPLSLNDEVAVDLAWKILQATKKDLGAEVIDPRQEALLEEMVVKRGRNGRKNGKGFYDYPDKGPKRLWPGLAELAGAPQPAENFDVDTLKQRFLGIQALESARCVEEGVITDVRDADVGSILGFGYAPFTGGTLSYIDGMGWRISWRCASGWRAAMDRASSRARCCAKWPRRARPSMAASRRPRASAPPERPHLGPRLG